MRRDRYHDLIDMHPYQKPGLAGTTVLIGFMFFLFASGMLVHLLRV